MTVTLGVSLDFFGMPPESGTCELSAAGRVRRDQNRADFLEFLYLADGRDNPEHPYANSYTGLFQSYCYGLGEAMLQDISDNWHEYETLVTED